MFEGFPGKKLVYQSILKRERVQKPCERLLPLRADGVAAENTLDTIGLEQNSMALHRNNTNYMCWRFEKDTHPKEYSSLTIEEMPEFASLSLSFKIAQGSDLPGDNVHGQNQHGNSNFELKDELRAWAMYKFTAKAPLRRNPIVLLHGIVSTITAFKSAVITAKAAVRNLKAANLSNKNAQIDACLDGVTGQHPQEVPRSAADLGPDSGYLGYGGGRQEDILRAGPPWPGLPESEDVRAS
jgi:hypothetical protein